MKKKLLALFLVASLAFVTACGNGDSGSGSGSESGSESGSDAAPVEQTLRIAYQGSPTDFSPITNTTTEGGEVVGMIIDTLVRQGENGAIEMGSGLAESWTVSEDQLVYTFTLRDATYSDGTPITAQDFEFYWKHMLNPETAAQYAYIMYPIVGAYEYNAGEGSRDDVGVVALDEKTLEVTLKSVTPYFLGMLGMPAFACLPQEFIEEQGSNIFLSVENMMFSGPFVMEEWNLDQNMVMVKNENYWDAENVTLERLEIFFVPETNTLVNMYDNGEIDLIPVQADFIAVYENEPGYLQANEPVTEYFFFNMENEFFSNENIRKAFSMAIDRNSHINDFMMNGATPAFGYVPPGMAGDIRGMNGDLLTDAGTEGVADEAKALLDLGLSEIGKTVEELSAICSLVTGEGDANLKTAQVYQQMWKDVLGVDVEIKSLAYALRQAEYELDFTMGKEGWGADYNDAYSFLELFETGSPYNNPGYSSEEYDALIAQSRVTTGDERLEILAEAERVLLEDCPIAPMNYIGRHYVAVEGLQGVTRNGVGLRVDYKYAYME